MGLRVLGAGEDAWAALLLHSLSPIVVFAEEAIRKGLTSFLDFPAVLVELVYMYDCPLERLSGPDVGSQDWFKSSLISVSGDVESVWKESEWRQKFQRCLSRQEVCDQADWLARVRNLTRRMPRVRTILRGEDDFRSRSIVLSSGDFSKLYPGCWLNDDLIDAYFYLITARAGRESCSVKPGF